MTPMEIERAFFERSDSFPMELHALCYRGEEVKRTDIKTLLYATFMPLCLTAGANQELPREMRNFILAVLSIPGTSERLRDMADALRDSITLERTS
jgi:hypothetical protein